MISNSLILILVLSLDVRCEDCLVGFEYHSVVNPHVFVDIQPGSVGTGFSRWSSVVEHPAIVAVILVLHTDVALNFGEKFVVDFDVAVWSSAQENVFLAILHVSN